MRDEILEELLDAIEIYFALTDRISSSVIRLGHKDGKDVEPALDYILMRDDLYERILETSRELPSL